jgi:hypothetical protein
VRGGDVTSIGFKKPSRWISCGVDQLGHKVYMQLHNAALLTMADMQQAPDP